MDKENQMENPGFDAAEVESIYCDPYERFVVSLITTYGDGNGDGVDTPEKAAYWALQLTRDIGKDGTMWVVHDRFTGETHRLLQGDFEYGDYV